MYASIVLPEHRSGRSSQRICVIRSVVPTGLVDSKITRLFFSRRERWFLSQLQHTVDQAVDSLEMEGYTG